MESRISSELILKETSVQTLAAAFEVHNVLGFGFLERVYQKALMLELLARDLKAEEQKDIRVLYKGDSVGSYFADIVVNDEIILEIKSVEGLTGAHEAQLLNYLKATGLKLGFLINFGRAKVEYRRMVR